MGNRTFPAMAEVYMWAAAGGFALFGYTMAKRLGLLDEVPRDPKARVASYSSNVLMVVKDQLFGAQLLSLTSERVDYIHKGARSSLWVENGALQCLYGKEQESFPVGDLGKLVFTLIGDEVSVQIVTSETDGAEHSTQVHVRVLPKSA